MTSPSIHPRLRRSRQAWHKAQKVAAEERAERIAAQRQRFRQELEATAQALEDVNWTMQVHSWLASLTRCTLA